MRLLIVPLLFSLAACDRSPDLAPDQASIPEPSFVSLASPPELPTIHFRITAPTSRALYLENCNGAISWGLEQEQSGNWVPAWGAEINGCHSAPIEIPAGTVREFRETLAVRAGVALPAGPYRLAVYGLYFTHDSPDHSAAIEVPHAFRMSQPFTPAAQAVP